jgi:hypothetical protein
MYSKYVYICFMKTKDDIIEMLRDCRKSRASIQESLRWVLDKEAMDYKMSEVSKLDIKIDLLLEILDYEEIDISY